MSSAGPSRQWDGKPKTLLTEGQWWSIRSCPFCGAEPGFRCTRPDGAPTTVHTERTATKGSGHA